MCESECEVAGEHLAKFVDITEASGIFLTGQVIVRGHSFHFDRFTSKCL